MTTRYLLNGITASDSSYYRYERDRTARDDRSYRDERSLRDDRSYYDESMMGQSYRRYGGGRNYDDRYDRRDESR